MTQQPNTDITTASNPPLTNQRVALIITSLSISIITLLIALISTSTFHRSWQSTREQIISAPQIDKNNAISSGRMFDRAEEIRTAAVARAKLPQPRPLTNEEAAHVIDLAQSQLPAKMSLPQIQSLTKELQKPGQQLVDPTIPISTSRSDMHGQPPFQVVLADTGGRGPGQSIRLMTYRCYLSRDDHEGVSLDIGLDGSHSKINSKTAADRASIVQHRPAIPLTTSLIPQWQAEEKRDLYFGIVSAIEIAIAAELLFAGITALRQKPRWAFYHRFYIWAQLALLTATALIEFAINRPNDADTFLISLFLLSAIYPVVLIFALPRRCVSVALID